MCFGAADKKPTDTGYYERQPPNSSPESMGAEREFYRIGADRLARLHNLKNMVRNLTDGRGYAYGTYSKDTYDELITIRAEMFQILQEMNRITTSTEQQVYRDVKDEIVEMYDRYCGNNDF